MLTNRLAMITSVTALVVSLTGAGAFAATQIDGATIKNGSIGVAKLSPKAIKQLHGAKGERGLRGFSGNDGSDGAIGSAGPAGAPGPAGGFNPAKVVYVTGPTVTMGVYPDPSYIATAIATCPAGYKAISGGFFASINDVAASVNTGDGSGWGVILANGSSITTTGNAYAVCAAP